MSEETSAREAQRAYWREVERHFPYNATVGLVQGAFALFAMGLMAPETVLPAYMKTLTDSKFLIGLPTAMSYFYWYAPSIFYIYFLQRFRQRKGIVIGTGIFARVAFALFAVSALVAGRLGAHAAIVMFLVAEGVLAFAASASALTWHDLVGRVIPPSRRGLFIGLREGSGQFAALAASVYLLWYLKGKEVSAATYFWPFTAGALVYLVSVVFFAITREPRWPADPLPARPAKYYAETFGALKTNPNFRTYVFVRCLLGLGAIFNIGLFVPYARDQFGISHAVVSGGFTAAQMIGSVVAAVLAGWIADRFGFRKALLSGVSMQILMLALGLSLGLVAPWATAIFLAIYFLAGAQGSAVWVANFNLMLSFGSVEDRPRYIAVTMLFAAPVGCAAALVSGFLVDRLGYRAVLALALTVTVAVWVTAYRVLREPSRHPAGSGEAA